MNAVGGDPQGDYSYCEDEQEEEFWRGWDAFKSDPKRQAMVRRILADLPPDEPAAPARTIEPCIDMSGRRI